MNNKYLSNNIENITKYKIREGDTPYKIAKNFKISLDELIKWNPTLNPIALNEGDYIIIKS